MVVRHSRLNFLFSKMLSRITTKKFVIYITSEKMRIDPPIIIVYATWVRLFMIQLRFSMYFHWARTRYLGGNPLSFLLWPHSTIWRGRPERESQQQCQGPALFSKIILSFLDTWLLPPPRFSLFFGRFLHLWSQTKAWHVFSTLQKKFLTDLWPYKWSDDSTISNFPENCGFFINDRKKRPNAWRCYIMVINGQNTSNQGILASLAAFYVKNKHL